VGIVVMSTSMCVLLSVEMASMMIVRVLERRGRKFPHLTGELVQAKTCLYSVTPDEHFVIGAHPGHEQVSIACGFSGHGFGIGPIAGKLIAEMRAQLGYLVEVWYYFAGLADKIEGTVPPIEKADMPLARRYPLA
jgi:hypothetical protein